jgi:hypothetical protein
MSPRSSSPTRSRSRSGRRRAKEQAQLIRFTGFGASELANGMFRRPGEVDFREGWDDIGSSLETAVSRATMPRSPAAPNMRISRRSSSSGRSGRGPAPRLARRPGAGARHRHGAVPCPDAGGISRRAPMSPASSSIRSPPASPGCCSRRRGSSMATSPAPIWRRSSISPSAIRPSPIAPSAPTAPIGRWAAPARLLHRPVDRPAEARRARRLRHQLMARWTRPIRRRASISPSPPT